MPKDTYYQRLYERLLEITAHPGPKTAARLIEENDILTELHLRSNYFQSAA
jgi:hypothetical protein